MAVTTDLSLPPGDGEEGVFVTGKVPVLTTVRVEPVGRWFEAFCTRRRQKHTLSHHSLQSSSEEEEEEDTDDEFIDDEEYLKTLDPKDWKNQDHYRVLGLPTIRFKASDDKVKRAYKHMVLMHHPDKRRARGLPVKEGDDDYFTCITRAYETLGVPVKKRAYDSVDPTFDDDIPPNDQDSKDEFFEAFGPVFERNARFSLKKHVPLLGNESSSYDDVNHFYTFWYEFDSWREYSYLDEDDKEKGENREERRWIEKQNKAARQKKKKEEMTRIRQLVDNAYACDPRVARFKEAEKQRKLAQKQAKKEAARLRAEEEERKRKEIEEIARKKKEAEEEAAKALAEAAKKEREAQKKVMKKEKKTMRTKVKEYEYFASDNDERVHNMQELEKLAETLSILSLQELNEGLTSGDAEKAKAAFAKKVAEVTAEQEKEKKRLLEAGTKSGGSKDESGHGKSHWGEDEVALLVKGVKLFPVGTVQRWETVGNFITQHMPTSKRSAKEVLGKAKELQRMDPNMKAEANKKAFDNFKKEHEFASVPTVEKADVSERFESVAEQQMYEMGTNPAPWTPDEQKLLEQALRTYPASVEERWEKIASVIPARSKKDCMKRYKELVEMVRAKKAAQAAASKKK